MSDIHGNIVSLIVYVVSVANHEYRTLNIVGLEGPKILKCVVSNSIT